MVEFMSALFCVVPAARPVAFSTQTCARGENARAAQYGARWSAAMKHVVEPVVAVPPLLIVAALGLFCGVFAGLATCLLWGAS
jgi:hypothetical protein